MSPTFVLKLVRTIQYLGVNKTHKEIKKTMYVTKLYFSHDRITTQNNEITRSLCNVRQRTYVRINSMPCTISCHRRQNEKSCFDNLIYISTF